MSEETKGLNDDARSAKTASSNHPLDNSDPFISQEIPPGVGDALLATIAEPRG